MIYLVLRPFRSYGNYFGKGDVVDGSKIRSPKLRMSEGLIIPAVSSAQPPEPEVPDLPEICLVPEVLVDDTEVDDIEEVAEEVIAEIVEAEEVDVVEELEIMEVEEVNIVEEASVKTSSKQVKLRIKEQVIL